VKSVRAVRELRVCVRTFYTGANIQGNKILLSFLFSSCEMQYTLCDCDDNGSVSV